MEGASAGGAYSARVPATARVSHFAARAFKSAPRVEETHYSTAFTLVNTFRTNFVDYYRIGPLFGAGL